jgi:hypothetical protein
MSAAFKLTLLMAAALAINSAAAETPDRWFTISQSSYHFKNQSQYNQNNQGFGFEWTVKNPWVHDTRLAGGRFYNSDRYYSNYWGVVATPYRLIDGTFNVQAGALLGTINGYPRANNGGYFPLLAPVISVQYGAAGANIFIIPPFAGVPATAALQLKVGF